MNMTEQEMSNFQSTTLTVANQLENINSVNRLEAYTIALAHARVLGLFLASSSRSNEEFLGKIDDLATMLKKEGLALRRTKDL